MLKNGTETMPEADFQAARRLFSSVYGADSDLFDGEGLSRVGDYLLHRRLGDGGAGIAYEGVRLGTQQPVTVKVLRRPIDDARSARHAWRELEMLEAVRCPSIPRLHDYGLHDGRLYIAYDYIEGERLQDYCNELDRRSRVVMLVKVARAVQQMHERQVLHRDLKPGNIIVDAEGEPHLIDLGLATVSEPDEAHSRTETGRPLGTLAFMAPEQARGDRDAISTRTDVFGLGATACAVLTGRPPHDIDGDEAEVLHRIARGAPRRLTGDLPGPLAAILETAMHPEPARRFASAAAFAEDMENWLEFRPVRSQRTTWFERRRLDIKRHPRRAAVMGALTVLALAATAFGVTQQFTAYRALAAKVTAETSLAETTTMLATAEASLAETTTTLATAETSLADTTTTLATVETSLTETTAMLAARRDDLASAESELERYRKMSAGFLEDFTEALRGDRFRYAYSYAVLLEAAIRNGVFSDEGLRDTEALLAAIGDKDVADARDLVTWLAACDHPRDALLVAMIDAAYPDEVDRAAQIVAWTEDALAAEDVDAIELLDALELHIREAIENR